MRCCLKGEGARAAELIKTGCEREGRATDASGLWNTKKSMVRTVSQKNIKAMVLIANRTGWRWCCCLGSLQQGRAVPTMLCANSLPRVFRAMFDFLQSATFADGV